MQSYQTEAGSNLRSGRGGFTAALGAALIALSLLRWPVTAMLVAPSAGSAGTPWGLVLVLQVGAETIFWAGVWLLGRNSFSGLLARVAAIRPVYAIFPRRCRAGR